MSLALAGGISLSECPTIKPTRIKIKLLWQIWIRTNNIKCSGVPSVIPKVGITVRQGGIWELLLQPLAGRRALTCCCLRLHICCSQRWFWFEALCSRPVWEREKERRLSPRHLHVRALESSIRLSQTYIAENRTKPRPLPTVHNDFIPTYLVSFLSLHFLEMLYLRSLFFYLCIIYMHIPPTEPIKLFYFLKLII